MTAFRLWFGRPPGRAYFRETTLAVMEAMDAADLYRQDADPERAKHMDPDDVGRLGDLSDMAAPLIRKAEVEEAQWQRFAAGLLESDGPAEVVE